MDKTEFAKLNGVQEAVVMYRIHGVTVEQGVNVNTLRAYLHDGGVVHFDEDFIERNEIEVYPCKTVTLSKEDALRVLRHTEKAAVDKTRRYNVGTSDYAKHRIQPWDIWREYHLDPWSADIVKRILRTKTVEGMTPAESRRMDLEKIKHICDELISQIDSGYEF